MSETKTDPEIRIVTGIRVTCPDSRDVLPDVLTRLHEQSATLVAHCIVRAEDRVVVRLVCDRAEDVALALIDHFGDASAAEVTTETFLAVTVENRPGVLSHLLRTITARNIAIDASFGSSSSESLFLALRTSDNPSAEDFLRDYLVLEDRRSV